MLKLVTSFKDLDIRQLVRVYEETLNALGADEGFRQLQTEQDFYDYLKEFFHTYGGKYALWVIDGRYCSALRLEVYRDGFLISGLETALDSRHRGYATSLVRSLIHHLSDTDCRKLYSHVDKGNAASLAVHEACGFERILEYAVYLDGSVYQSSCTFCLAL